MEFIYNIKFFCNLFVYLSLKSSEKGLIKMNNFSVFCFIFLTFANSSKLSLQVHFYLVLSPKIIDGIRFKDLKRV